jgi:hypothetical protein
LTPFSILMPLKIGVHRYSDLDRFIHIGLPSLRRFMKADLREFVIAAPTRDIPVIRKAIRCEAGINFRLVDENQYLAKKLNCDGWVKQQFLKLSAGHIINEDWILVLDSDVVFTREITDADLFDDRRAAINLEPAKTHAGWWRASMEILGTKSAVRRLDDQVMGVTPELLHGPTLRELCERLGRIAGNGDWQSYLAKRRRNADNSWTEYCLYWCHVLQRGLADQLYSSTRTVICGNSIWSRGDWAKASDDEWKAVFDPRSPHIASVIQSNTDVRLSKIISALYPHIHGSRYSYPKFAMRHFKESLIIARARTETWLTKHLGRFVRIRY